MTVTVRDLRPFHQDCIKLVGGCIVQLIHQQTPFGQRRYFRCPCCGRRCAKLHFYRKVWHCQTCLPYRLYAKRQDLYGNGRNLIVWHMQRLLEKNGLSNLHRKPKHMHRRRFDDICLKYMRLQELHRFCIYFQYRPTAGHIKKIMNGTELIDIRKYLFRPAFRKCY